ncbi:MAG: hypothetical protein M3R72_01985, partial [Bacteroidota bacterium]|nr:hypothetical protein [Bacteroidota bacterium]
IWNSSAVNNSIGTLELLSNGRFRLHLVPGQVMPCQGIIGMRYYQFDCPNQFIDGILCAPGSYVDFADGHKTQVDESFSDSITTIHATQGGVYYANTPLMGFYVIHHFPSALLRTVTVYHSDIRGFVGFDNWDNDAPNLTNLKNLRGYVPNETRNLVFHSTQDSTLNTFKNIVNKDSIIHLVNVNFLSGDGGVTHMLHYNFGSFIKNPNIRCAWIGTTDTILINNVLPNIPVNFKKLSNLQSVAYNYTDDVKLLMPEATLINIQYGLQSYQVDTILNQLARSVTLNNGNIYLKYGNQPRTSASDAAVSILKAKGWYIFTAVDTAFTPNPNTVLYDSVPPETLLYSEFADYLNARLHTSYTVNQILELYHQKCGTIPSLCSPLYSTSSLLTLCGNNEPVFKTLAYKDTPCQDLDKMAYTAAEEKWQLYVDSVRNVFDTAYYNKCMSAKNLESFKVTYQTSEYHYTLYYYDQAGNLVKTVPPEGVDDRHGDATFLANVKIEKANEMINGPSSSNSLVPNHTLETHYRYNTLNQVIAQKTPDAGISNFWYDRLGRLAVSQNAKQLTLNKYSYTLYDELGRITEVGQKPQSAGSMAQTVSRDPSQLNIWLTGGGLNKEQITRTRYDLSYINGDNSLGNLPVPILVQRNLRNRVSYTMVYDAEPDPNVSGTHNAATFYTYDIHGNVDTLVQDFITGIMQSTGNRFKKIVYDYDLISGKVNQVAYQPGFTDEFYHRYEYDAENRIEDVMTSHDKLIWEKDARYSYYKHGPLARAIIGQQQVQGIDYAYTLQGWLKGVNSSSLNTTDDMGQDALPTGSVINQVAKDVYGFNLNYFNGDYKSISGLTPFAGAPSSLPSSNAGMDLFNGNISSMAVNIPKLGTNAMLYGYHYDQLNRIVAMDAFTGLNTTNNTWTPIATDNYRERVSYDANGNILTYNRHGADVTNNVAMDDLTYGYNYQMNNGSFVLRNGNKILLNNKLRHVKDAVATTGGDDIKDEPDDNYNYDEIGNLTKDTKEGITNISWNVYGKILNITKSGSTISYTYDAAGNRIS